MYWTILNIVNSILYLTELPGRTVYGIQTTVYEFELSAQKYRSEINK